MPTIVREDHDDLNITLTVNIPKEDYEPAFKKKLKEYSKQANLKGFRKGQVPVAVVRKMFGQGALVDIINDLLGKELDTYLKEADFDILGQPLPVEHEEIKLTTKQLIDYTFKFDLGLVPAFEVKGLEEEAFGWYDVTIPDSMVEDDLQDALKRMGKRIEAADELQEGDVFKIEAKELGEDGTPKTDGLSPTFTLSFDELTEDIVEDVFTKKNGDSFKFDISQLSKDKDEAFIKKHFLQLDEELDASVTYGNNFEAKIIEVNRMQHAELNQEFFDGYFGPGNVSSEEEAKGKMKENIKRYYSNQSDGILFGQIVEKLKAANPLSLPTDFLARWVAHTGQVKPGKTSSETVEDMQEGLQWTIIRNKLAERFELKVDPEEVKQLIRNQIIQYMGGQDFGGMMDDMVNRMLQNEQQVNQAYNQILADKLFKELKEVVTLSEMEIGTEEFEKILAEERAKNNPEPELPTEETMTTVDSEELPSEEGEVNSLENEASISEEYQE